jgi:GAF domain-containing protein
VNEAKDLIEVRYALVTSWVDDLQRLLPVLAQPEVPISDALRETVNFVRSRLVDLTQELQGSRETVRAGVWLLSEADHLLHFALGTDATGPWDPFSVGEGIIGRSFVEIKPWNIPDRRRRPEYVKLDPKDPFQGLLCVPLTSGSSSPIGVLCIDRTKAEAFPDSSVKLVSTLAGMITLALMNPKHKKALADIKEPPSLPEGSS